MMARYKNQDIPVTDRRTAAGVLVLMLALMLLPGMLPLPVGGYSDGTAQAADISAQLSAANTAIARFHDATRRFQNRLAMVKSEPNGNPCTDAQLQSLQTQILMHHVQARNALTAAVARAFPGASAIEHWNRVFSDDEDQADSQSLSPEQRSALAQTLGTFRVLRYDDATHSLLAHGCVGDFLDMFIEAEKAVDEEAGRDADLPKTIGELLDRIMTPSEKHKAETTQPEESSQPETSDRTWDMARFNQLMREFDRSYDAFSLQAITFINRLDLLVGGGSEEMCHDAVLAYSFTMAIEEAQQLALTYYQIVDMVNPGRDQEQAEGTVTGFSDPTDLPLEVALAYADVITRWQRAYPAALALSEELHSKAPQCDSEDLKDAGLRIAEQGQDPESGLDADAPHVSGDSDDPGGGGDDGTHFEKAGSVFFQEDRTATCGNVTMTLRLVSSPAFPDVVQPDGVYTISFEISWSTTGSQFEELGIGVFVDFLGLQQESDTFRARSGNEILSFTFRGADVDFSQGGSAISVILGGGVLCTDGSNDDDGASATISQGYFRSDGR
jgi:hypothetical protein